jgi:superfamily I DNA/RNA helicase
MNLNYTKEQEDILNINTPGTYGISAYAGTGKTTTLVEYANKYPNKKMLYLVYNANMKADAQKRMPENVTVLTTFGLAYRAVFSNTDLNPSKLGNLTSFDIKNILDFNSKAGFGMAIKVANAFNEFCNSVGDFNEVGVGEAPYVRNGVKTLFNLIKENNTNKIPHSFYYKYFEQNMDEFLPEDYDVVMLDEAQDSDEITVKIINELNSEIKIVVGDEFQKIYGWRGAIDVFKYMDFDKTLFLSTSFRFPQTTSDLANSIIEQKTGSWPSPEIKSFEGYKKPDEIKTECWISRTNANAIKIVLENEDKDFKLNKNIDELNTDMSDAIELKKSKPIKKNLSPTRKYLAGLSAKDKKDALESSEISIKIMIELLSKFPGAEVNKAIQSLKNNARKRKDIILLGTAHSVKGLEYDKTIVMKDFKSYGQLHAMKNNSDRPDIIEEEFNLLYVANTRSRT